MKWSVLYRPIVYWSFIMQVTAGLKSMKLIAEVMIIRKLNSVSFPVGSHLLRF